MGHTLNKMYKLAVALGASMVVMGVLSACAPTTASVPFDTDDSSLLHPPGNVPAMDASAPADDPFAYTIAELTMREGLTGISQRYIEPVDLSEVALSGLRGLSTIDPGLRLDVSANGKQLVLSGDLVPLARLPIPETLDAAAWARLTTDVLRTTRAYSPDMKHADNERVYEAMFDGMLSSLDIFSRYAGAEEARAHRARRDGFGGIGIRFTKASDGILITHVSPTGPAMDVGIKPGDVILNVNGEKTAGRKLRDVAKLLRGPVGSLISLSVSRLNSEANAPDRTIAFSVKREHIVPETVQMTVLDDLMVISIRSFNKNTTSSVHDILRANDKAIRNGTYKGVVMDLRGNPGGLLSQAVGVADLFLHKGRIIATHGRHPDSHHQYTAGGVDLARGLPLAVLVDGDSASAAEIVASALQDLGRAVVIGTASYGKGTVQTVIRLPNDGEMTLTWSRFIAPSGYAIHGLGVMPAVCATNTGVSTQASEENPAAGESLSNAILAPGHIDESRNTMDAWRAAGIIFDGRRGTLRRTCPAKAFKPGKNGDFLLKLAGQVIHDPTLYERAVFLPQSVNTASR